MLAIKIAWRNIWRYKKRTLITILLSALCTMFLIWFEALNDGSHAKMIRDVVEMYPGYIQIQEKRYFENPSYDHLLFDTKQIKTRLNHINGIDTISLRFEAPALFSSDEVSYGGILIGINPSNEARISRIKQALVAGRYLTDQDTNAVYIGKDLAKKLQLSIGDECVFLSAAIDRSIAADTLVVVGLFESNLFDSDIQFVFVNKSFLDSLFLVEDKASYIVVKPSDKDQTFLLQDKLNHQLRDTPFHVLTWRELLASFVKFVEMDKAMSRVGVVIVVLVVFFVIMIFKFMSIYHRTKEVGLMRAMGVSDSRIIGMFYFESIMMVLISLLMGGIGGAWLAIYFEVNPLELTFSQDVLEMYQQFGMLDFTIPTKFSVKALLFGVSIVFMINMMALVIPLWKVLKVKPRAALQGK